MKDLVYVRIMTVYEGDDGVQDKNISLHVFSAPIAHFALIGRIRDYVEGVYQDLELTPVGNLQWREDGRYEPTGNTVSVAEFRILSDIEYAVLADFHETIRHNVTGEILPADRIYYLLKYEVSINEDFPYHDFDLVSFAGGTGQAEIDELIAEYTAERYYDDAVCKDGLYEIEFASEDVLKWMLASKDNKTKLEAMVIVRSGVSPEVELN